MSELTLLILRLGFLVTLWLFIFAIVYALRSDLFGAPARRLRGEGPNPPASTPPSAPKAAALQAAPVAGVITPGAGAMPSAGSSGPARTLMITSGVAAGTSLPLDEDLITIGRSPDSTLVIVDEYTSTYHARLTRDSAGWTLTDLDSTNGTRVDGVRMDDPIRLATFVPVTIGTTTFELRP
ncbi:MULTISPECIES: FHA domain-containing protein [unclassified Leucobacter]|uniref:FHA domain-containing protein FhaB/FipA n=1 Tax=unclassified Leucobacter TaxID=2621730 RepID=UPI00165DF8A8|nr:FHA domain-containing protein [Leucobacter sp. CX169]MBC9926961.1 FHA domain-containing protein [Leucobacter sp. cx-169]